MCQKSF